MDRTYDLIDELADLNRNKNLKMTCDTLGHGHLLMVTVSNLECWFNVLKRHQWNSLSD
jgi:hypothetical protein